MRSNLGITASGELIGSVDPLTGETWRFHVNSVTGQITRGRKYQLPDDGGDQWRWYWDGGQMVVFYDEGFRGVRACTEGEDTEGEDTERAMLAYTKSRESGDGEAMDRLAVRLTGQTEARFIVVHLDRGTDLYALSWGGDADHEWRDEIEAVWNGDVWRCETEEYVSGDFLNGVEDEWQPADDLCEEWYGEDKADEAWKHEFPLAEFPAERVLIETGE